MSTYDTDLFVIGAGSGGVRAARMAAQSGARVAIAEEYRYGGTCVIRGCVPKKLMVYASGFSEAFEDAAGFGWRVGERSHDWPALIAAKDAEIDRLEGIYRTNLEKAGAVLHSQRAVVVGPNSVRLADGREISAETILIATGGAPFVPDIPGAEHARTTNDVFDLPQRPERVLIVGGGYIAMEFAGIFHGLGSAVTVSYRRDLPLRGFDDDLRAHLTHEMRAKGIDLRLETDIARLEKARDAYAAVFADGATLDCDFILYATGRNPNTAGLGLEAAGIDLDKNGAIKVDAYSRTNIPSIYAVGDVTDRVALTPVAIHEAMAFWRTVFQGQPTSPDHDLIPTATFSQPEIGTVGMTEAEARRGHEVEIYRSVFRPMLHTLSGREERMLMKLVVDKASRRVLGVHIAGHGAGEMIQCLGVAVKMGATKDDFDRTMAVHPTASEELVTMRAPVG